MANFSDPYQLLKINGRPIGIGADRSISIERSPVEGGSGLDIDWNGNAEGNASAFWRKWTFRLSINGAIIPPALEKAMWTGQQCTLETAFEERLDGFVDVSVTPRRGPPDVRLSQKLDWNPVPGSFSYVLLDGSDEVSAPDGGNTLPDGITADMVETTVFRNVFDVIVQDSFSGTIDQDGWAYSGQILYRERR